MGETKVRVGRLEALRARHAREERALIREAMGRGDVLREAAEWLGVSRSTLQSIVERDAELGVEWRKHVIACHKERLIGLRGRAAAAERRLDAARRGGGA